jgi:hypothetical protein
MAKVETELTSINIIRSETVFSKLPTHNLSGKKRLSIKVTKSNEQGQTDLHWLVEAIPKYGLPGQLAYKIDTIIVNEVIDKLGRPLPRLIRLGTIPEICERLGLKLGGRTFARVRKALLQNAFAAITAKLNYKGVNGHENIGETVFNRYGVVFTGETLPNGLKADAVYLVLNDPYFDVLNKAPYRPLDYDYLKDLSPTAQRFYEILSYKMFVALKHGYTKAKLLYSEYCTFSAQQRYFDYDHFKKQMYKVHKPHLESKYITKVEYETTIDAQGKPDWIMYYTPGAKARAEYRACNDKNLNDDFIDITAQRHPAKKESTKKKNDKTNNGASDFDSKRPTKLSSAKQNQEVKPQAQQAALQLVQYFHKLSRNKDAYQPSESSRELLQADKILNSYGQEKANFIVSFSIEEAKKTKFRMRTFGAVEQYVGEALKEYERREQEQIRTRKQKQEQMQQEEAFLEKQEAELGSLPEELYRRLYEKAKVEILDLSPHLKENQKGFIFRSRLADMMLTELNRLERAKN